MARSVKEVREAEPEGEKPPSVESYSTQVAPSRQDASTWNEHPQVIGCDIQLGCDPELFFEQDGSIIGAEKVFSEKGLANRNGVTALVLDGVQAELNPEPQYCRQALAGQIALAMQTLRDHLKQSGGGVTACFTQVVEVSKAELASLSERARVLGCAPSLNGYDKDASIKCNPSTYRKRSAGGHIHLGIPSRVWGDDPTRLGKLLDIILGNTCVLIDRDPQAAERRKVYGRACEFRLPKHGFEYRTLSNFWLRSYPLMSMVFGLARLAVNVCNTKQAIEAHNASTQNMYDIYKVRDNFKTHYSHLRLFNYGFIHDPASDLLQRSNLKRVQAAINQNDADLAMENWEVLKEWMGVYNTSCDTLRDKTDIARFETFFSLVAKHGLAKVFPEDPMTHWCGKSGNNGVGGGWEYFMRSQIPGLSKQLSAAPAPKEQRAEVRA